MHDDGPACWPAASPAFLLSAALAGRLAHSLQLQSVQAGDIFANFFTAGALLLLLKLQLHTV